MPATIKDIQTAIQAVYGCESPNTVPGEDAVILKMRCGIYTAFVCIRLFVDMEHEIDDDVQGIGMSYTFTDEQGTVADFQDKQYTDLLLICDKIIDHLDWSAISPVETPKGSVEVCLYRAFGTSKEDLEKARRGDIHSQLRSALHHMSEEFTLAAPIMHAFATDQMLDPSMVKQIMRPSDKVLAAN